MLCKPGKYTQYRRTFYESSELGKKQNRRENIVGRRRAYSSWGRDIDCGTFCQTCGMGCDRLWSMDSLEEGKIMFDKIKMPKMPKIKMPNVIGNAKDMSKKLTGEIGNKTKGAVKSIKGLNPFKK